MGYINTAGITSQEALGGAYDDTAQGNTFQNSNSLAETLAQVQQIYDNFDDRYLGVKTADPALDNDGNAILIGALYFNSTTNTMMEFSATGWKVLRPITVSATPPTNPAINSEWIDSNTGKHYTYIADANSSQWVETFASVVADDISLRGDLALSSGASLVTTIAAGTGAVPRTLQAIGRDIVSAKGFGATLDGVANDSTAIINAYNSLSSAGGSIFIPPGICLASGITFSKPIHLIGAGVGATKIRAASATANIITLDAAFCAVESLTFDTSPTRTAGSYISITKNCSNSRVRDFYMTGQFIGITGVSINSIWIDTGTMFNTAIGGYGIRLLGDGVTPAGNDIYLNKITMSGDANVATAGIQITNNGAINITDCDIIRHGRDLSIEPGNGEVATAIYALNSYFDTATTGMSIVPTGTGTVQGVRCVGCWFGNQDGYGVSVGSAGTVSGVELVSPQMFDNISGGVLLNGGTDFHCIGGAITAKTNGVGNGVTIAAGVSAFHFLGTRIGNGYLKPGHAVGIFIANGASNQYSIIGCDLSGNTTPLTNGGTGTLVQIIGNIGVNPGTTANISVTASPFTYTAGAAAEMVYINQGTVSLVTVQGVGVFQSSNVAVRLNARQSMVVTYSAAPGMARTID